MQRSVEPIVSSFTNSLLRSTPNSRTATATCSSLRNSIVQKFMAVTSCFVHAQIRVSRRHVRSCYSAGSQMRRLLFQSQTIASIFWARLQRGVAPLCSPLVFFSISCPKYSHMISRMLTITPPVPVLLATQSLCSPSIRVQLEYGLPHTPPWHLRSAYSKLDQHLCALPSGPTISQLRSDPMRFLICPCDGWLCCDGE